jgi:chromosome segregation ATPase
MSTQSIRNIITNSISRIISDVKERSKEEIKKNTQNINQNLISSKSIINHLKSNQNTETCSSKGKEQYEKKSDKLKKELNKAENILLKSINKLQELENKIKGLTTQNTELPPGVSNPFESIKGITCYFSSTSRSCCKWKSNCCYK